MSLPQVVSRDEWLAARKALLAKEKEPTRARDALNAERRRLPMVRIDKDYVFEGPDGPGGAARPVRGPPPADRRPLHVRPELGRRLPELHGRRRRDVGRSARAPAQPRHDVRLVSRAPLAKIERLQGAQGLDVPVVLVVRQRLQLRLPRHARRVGRAGRVQLPHAAELEAVGHGWRARAVEMPGTSCFLRDGDACSTRTRPTPAAPSRSAARTTSSTSRRSAARRTGRSRRAARRRAAPGPTELQRAATADKNAGLSRGGPPRSRP